MCVSSGCNLPLGVAKGGAIPDDSFTSSSFVTFISNVTRYYVKERQGKFARLNPEGLTGAVWASHSTDIDPWIQVDLMDIMNITGMMAQGYNVSNKLQFVSEIRVKYGMDSFSLKYIEDDQGSPQVVSTILYKACMVSCVYLKANS